jgi:hypothetical protein
MQVYQAWFLWAVKNTQSNPIIILTVISKWKYILLLPYFPITFQISDLLFQVYYMKSHISHSRLKFFSQFITFLNKYKNSFFALVRFLIGKNHIEKTRTVKKWLGAPPYIIFRRLAKKTFVLATRYKVQQFPISQKRFFIDKQKNCCPNHIK